MATSGPVHIVKRLITSLYNLPRNGGALLRPGQSLPCDQEINTSLPFQRTKCQKRPEFRSSKRNTNREPDHQLMGRFLKKVFIFLYITLAAIKHLTFICIIIKEILIQSKTRFKTKD